MKKIDYAVQIVYIAVLLGLSIFWGCHYDFLITVLGVVIAIASGIATFYQYKKMRELDEEQESHIKD